MTDIDLDRLRELAMKATPGPRFVGISYQSENGAVDNDYVAPGYYDNIGVIAGDTTVVGCNEYNVFHSRDDANFIAACSPDMILKLLDMVEGKK